MRIFIAVFLMALIAALDGTPLQLSAEIPGRRPFKPPARDLLDLAIGGQLSGCLLPYAAPSWSDIWKKGTEASSLFRNSRPNEPGPQLLAMAEDAFCRYTRSNGQCCCTRV